MKQTILRIITVLLVLVWMLIVFMLSSEIADDSTKTSGGVIRWIITLFNKDIPQDVLEAKVDVLQPIVRKLAHFTLYTLGGMLITIMFMNFKEYITKTKTMSFMLGAIYAMTDEIHQLLVPGRSGEIRDVLIDSLGVMLGIYIIYLLVCIKVKFISKTYKYNWEYKGK